MLLPFVNKNDITDACSTADCFPLMKIATALLKRIERKHGKNIKKIIHLLGEDCHCAQLRRLSPLVRSQHVHPRFAPDHQDGCYDGRYDGHDDGHVDGDEDNL